MKKIVSLLLASALILSLAACGGDNSATSTPPAEESSAPVTTQPVAEPVSDEPQYGGTATIYYPKFYNYFDPALMDEYQFSFWYETLWIIDLQLRPRRGLHGVHGRPAGHGYRRV